MHSDLRLRPLTVLFIGIEHLIKFLVQKLIAAMALEIPYTRTVPAEPGHGVAEVVHLPELSLVEKLEFNKTVQNSDGVLRVSSSVWHVNTPFTRSRAILSCLLLVDIAKNVFYL
jgi:hypothetical protein